MRKQAELCKSVADALEAAAEQGTLEDDVEDDPVVKELSNGDRDAVERFRDAADKVRDAVEEV